ncbi:hypothetical protein WJM97_00270 [Okeanomitos corallinicola TIOX110]|uniref:Uncharacterized protein n=1 Tax=Okeanomitos corallinicola TIOX110 TaxID=3133117 RepID=A0ABZ2UT89_9CYAN
MKYLKMAKKLVFTVLTGIIVTIIGISIFSHPAISQQVDFRVNNLESDVRRLELRLNQIELLINKNSQIPVSRINRTPTKKPNLQRNLSQVEKDKMFNRLSTLFVELKQQVNGLTNRVVKLESGK